MDNTSNNNFTENVFHLAKYLLCAYFHVIYDLKVHEHKHDINIQLKEECLLCHNLLDIAQDLKQRLHYFISKAKHLSVIKQ